MFIDRICDGIDGPFQKRFLLQKMVLIPIPEPVMRLCTLCLMDLAALLENTNRCRR